MRRPGYSAPLPPILDCWRTNYWWSAPLQIQWPTILQRLEGLSRFRLMYVERTELLRSGAVHVLRVCNGLNSFILPERLTLQTADALASESVHLFSDGEQPVIELSPVVVRPPHTDSFYFLNGNRKHVEYLCYDGVGDEYYRPDGYQEAIAEFLAVDENTDTVTNTVTDRTVAAPAADAQTRNEDITFGDLGGF